MNTLHIMVNGFRYSVFMLQYLCYRTGSYYSYVLADEVAIKKHINKGINMRMFQVKSYGHHSRYINKF